MNILEEFDKWHVKVSEARMHLKSIQDERIKWCRENKDLIKSIFPEKNKVYQVVSIPIEWGRDLEDAYYLFKVKDLRFSPSELFDRYDWKQVIYPKVKGEVYDFNMKKMDLYEPKICITQLKEPDQSIFEMDFTTFVYVMIDKNTGYYKIGRSKNPKTRERTLQSEKPTIEMLFFSEAKMSDEKTLHDKYYDKRIRGEWFDLKGSDILEIKQYFNRP